ncbi:ATP-binding cassette domain-containing protein [Gryllotalpicola reticulitermitis]|uniref:ATP-binding cassette domain-containing protein n=1 Tax=Gryllotalpicola reticulitermitis TaxID=1184153 RepID=A0ABV8Q7W2_9MICO
MNESPDTDQSPIVVHDLVAEYRNSGRVGVHALRGVSFTVGRGEILGVLGESGSGKTTLARILAGELVRKGPGGFDVRISGGEALVNGIALRTLSKTKLNRLTFHTAYLPQDANDRLDRTSTVSELIAEPIFARDKRFDPDAAQSRALSVLDAVELPLSVLDRYPYELSDGQRQRVAIARSLVLGPNVLVADEPTAGIDVTVRDTVVRVIGKLREDPSFAALIVTHDLAVLRQLGATIAVLHDGVIVGYGDIDTVFAEPNHSYVARLGRALGWK